MEKPILDPKIAEDLFYARDFAFSYSSLNKLLYSPSLFYKEYILGLKEDTSDKSMLEGKIIHKLLLDQDTFDEEFVISLSKLPSDNVVDVVNKIYELFKEELIKPEDMYVRANLDEYADDIVKILEEKNLYQKMGVEIRLKKVINEEGIAYFEFLKQSRGKTIISAEMYSSCVDVVYKLKQDPIMKSMGMHYENPDMGKVYNELDIIMDMKDDGYPFAIKGFIDNLYIDEKQKTIRINDIKTTSKSITEFPDTVDYYNYWMQAAIYERLVRNILKDKYGDWEYIFSFIVIDKYNQIYQFEVSQDSMTNWQIDLQEKLREAKYHYERRDYSLPYKFLTSKVTL